MVGFLRWIEPLDLGFFYNAQTNALVKIVNNDVFERIIQKIASLPGVEKEKLLKYGEFSTSENNPFSFNDNYVEDALKELSDSGQIKDLVEYTLTNAYNRKLVLEVTDACNLRCKYCSYTINSQSTSTKAKGHSNNFLSKENAISAIDEYFKEYGKLIEQLPNKYLRNKFNTKNPPVIGFYGGEPLLCFPLIEELICYVKSNYKEYNPTFNVTTNGTLLTPSIIDFFAENDVELAISFDGAKSQHDKNRVYPNGLGSFDDVYKSLIYLRSHHSKYSLNNVTIQAVDAPNYDKSENDSFFDQMSIDGKSGGISNLMFLAYNDYGCEEVLLDSMSSQNSANELDIINQIVKFGKQADNKSDKERFISDYLSENTRLKEILLRMLKLTRNIHKGGLIPGKVYNSCYLTRSCLLVDAKSNYHICERTDFSFPVGSVKDGIDKEKLAYLYEEFNNVRHSKRCNECWLRILCPICVAHIIKDGKLSLPNEIFCYDLKVSSSLYITAGFILANLFPQTLDTLDELFSEVNDMSIDSFLNNI